MKSPKPIALITLTESVDLDDIAPLAKDLYEAGYLSIFTRGYKSNTTIRVLTPRKMKRSEYKELVNAAKAILSK